MDEFTQGLLTGAGATAALVLFIAAAVWVEKRARLERQADEALRRLLGKK